MKKYVVLVCITIISMFSLNGYTQEQKLEIHYGPYLQAVSDNEATVVWVTNKKCVSWVEVAPDDGSHFYAEERGQYFHSNFGKKNIGTLHKVKLDNLNPETNYRYRIFSKEVIKELKYLTTYGMVASSTVYGQKAYTFSTLNNKKSHTNFLMVNDIHEKSDLFASLIANVDVKQIDFVMLNGDMVSSMDSEKQLFEGFLQKASEMFAAEVPMFFARGNHETRGIFSTEFINYFPTTTSQPYYTFKQGPAYFIVLDAGEDKPDSDVEYHGLATFDKYREDQAKWLKGVVESEEFKNAKAKIVVIHIPPMGGTWHGNLELNRLFMPILNSADIDFMLCGHEHRHRVTKKGENGANFPMLVNSNTHSAFIQVSEDKIVTQIKDDKGAKFFDFTIDL